MKKLILALAFVSFGLTSAMAQSEVKTEKATTENATQKKGCASEKKAGCCSQAAASKSCCTTEGKKGKKSKGTKED